MVKVCHFRVLGSVSAIDVTTEKLMKVWSEKDASVEERLRSEVETPPYGNTVTCHADGRVLEPAIRHL